MHLIKQYMDCRYWQCCLEERLNISQQNHLIQKSIGVCVKLYSFKPLSSAYARISSSNNTKLKYNNDIASLSIWRLHVKWCSCTWLSSTWIAATDNAVLKKDWRIPTKSPHLKNLSIFIKLYLFKQLSSANVTISNNNSELKLKFNIEISSLSTLKHLCKSARACQAPFSIHCRL